MKVPSSIFYYFSILTLGAAQRGNLQCGQVSSSKRIVIENPTQIVDSCQYTIEAYSAFTCQLLIQFERFLLPQPTILNGEIECVDRFTVGDFVLCGDNAQQHLHIPIEGAAYSGRKRRISLDFQLPSRWSQTRWSLVITQLDGPHTSNMHRLRNLPGLGLLQILQNATRTFCPPPANFGDWDRIAPRGCHQYFTQPTGTIRSFNFNAISGTLYMPNMNYVICVKAPEGVEKIDYTVEKFSMSVENVLRSGFDTDCYPPVFTPGTTFRSDFLMIPQSSLPNRPFLKPTHYCGQSLDNDQLTASLPFLIYFQSDHLADPTETGFIINYRVK